MSRLADYFVVVGYDYSKGREYWCLILLLWRELGESYGLSKLLGVAIESSVWEVISRWKFWISEAITLELLLSNLLDGSCTENWSQEGRSALSWNRVLILWAGCFDWTCTCELVGNLCALVLNCVEVSIDNPHEMCLWSYVNKCINTFYLMLI